MVADFTYLNSARSTSCQQFRPERRQRPQRQKWQSCAQTLPPAALRQPTATTSTAAGAPASGRRFPKQESPRRPDGPTLNHGDRLQVSVDADRWELLNDDGTAAVGQPPVASTALPGVTKAHAEVLAIVSWDKELSEPEYRKGLRSDAWEVVVPEPVFEPDHR